MIGINKIGHDWLIMKSWLHTKIENLHRNMEQPLNVEEYNQLRGSILLIREIIELVEPSSPPKEEEDDYGISGAE